jgi:translation initiation factor 5B
MAPKKKGGKKAQDDWENDLGETVDPIAQAEERAKEEEAAKEADEEAMGGGLLAALKKNRGKKAKKGKVVEDFVEGEDPASVDDAVEPTDEATLAAKAPEEATFDDEEDIYSGPVKKGKGGKGGKSEEKAEEPGEDDEERDASGRIMTKKEKEKAKKEREKQRKKEQVSTNLSAYVMSRHANGESSGCKEEGHRSSCQSRTCKSCTRSERS